MRRTRATLKVRQRLRLRRLHSLDRGGTLGGSCDGGPQQRGGLAHYMAMRLRILLTLLRRWRATDRGAVRLGSG